MSNLISRQEAIEAIRKLPNAGIHWFVSAVAVFDALLKLPPTQPDTYEALRILDAIHSSGRLDYGDYCDLHDAISEIGWAQNG